MATGFLIWRRAGKAAGIREFRIGHGVAAIVPALGLVAIWWYRESPDFNTLLPGLAWKTWLVLYTIPSALVLLFRIPRRLPS